MICGSCHVVRTVRSEVGSYTSPDDPGEPKTQKPRVSVTEDEARLIAAILADRYVLEIGTGLGVSTRAIARRAAVLTVDDDPWVHRNVWPVLPVSKAAGMDEVPDIPRFTGAFIDGHHSRSAVAADVTAVLARLMSGGVLLLHDWHNRDVEQGAKAAGIEPYAIATTYGIGIWVKP